MKLYIHTGKGHYIGSTVIVQTRTLSEAKMIVRTVLNDHGLKGEELNVSLLQGADYKPLGKVLYIDNGDY